MDLIERFLDYVSFDTQSREDSTELPSTPGQLVLARHLHEQLIVLGAKGCHLSAGGYVYATIPATPGREDVPPLGFLAHMDTAPDASGKDVKPQRVTYTGGVLPLGSSGRVLDPAVFPELNAFIDKELIVTDGTTLLGADDKAGIAIIMSAAEALLAPDAPAHGEIHVAFTPDEEIGEGTRGFEPDRFVARLAFTVDGGPVNELETANFNAACATFKVRGVSVHPGTAKGVMVNAIKVATEIVSALPSQEAPEHTEERQGFFHPTDISGTVAASELRVNIRDHAADGFAARKEVLARIAAALNAKYGTDTVTLSIRDQYRNMEEKIAETPFLVCEAENAIRAAGLTPKIVAIRGGTDGANLAQMGIPCPNLGTGGRNYHGELEYAVVGEMRAGLAVVLALAQMPHTP